MSSPATSRTLRRIPPLSYTIQNIFLSISTVIAAYASLGLTVFIALPLSVIRLVLLLARDTYLYRQRQQKQENPNDKKKKRKVVLVVGATHGIGLNIVKQYARAAEDDHVNIVAVGRSKDELAQLKGDFDGFIERTANVKLHTECFDIGWDPKAIVENVTNWDKKYGAITHLYAASGLSAEPDKDAWGIDDTLEMVQTDVIGLICMVLATYERMKIQRQGKICIVGSTTGLFAPANMISYASSKAFLNTFGTSLRALAHCCSSPSNINGIHLHNAKTSPDGIEVTTVFPGYIEFSGIANALKENSGSRYKSADREARKVVNAVERGGEGLCLPSMIEGLLIYGLKGVNPICDEVARWASWKLGVATKRYLSSL